MTSRSSEKSRARGSPCLRQVTYLCFHTAFWESGRCQRKKHQNSESAKNLIKDILNKSRSTRSQKMKKLTKALLKVFLGNLQTGSTAKFHLLLKVDFTEIKFLDGKRKSSCDASQTTYTSVWQPD